MTFDIIMGGTVSQISYLGPSFCDLEKVFSKFLTMFPDFGHNIKTRAYIINLRHMQIN